MKIDVQQLELLIEETKKRTLQEGRAQVQCLCLKMFYVLSNGGK